MRYLCFISQCDIVCDIVCDDGCDIYVRYRLRYRTRYRLRYRMRYLFAILQAISHTLSQSISYTIKCAITYALSYTITFAISYAIKYAISLCDISMQHCTQYRMRYLRRDRIACESCRRACLLFAACSRSCKRSAGKFANGSVMACTHRWLEACWECALQPRARCPRPAPPTPPLSAPYRTRRGCGVQGRVSGRQGRGGGEGAGAEAGLCSACRACALQLLLYFSKRLR